jgi:integrase
MNKVQPITIKAKIDEMERILGEWDEKYRIMFLIGIYSGLRISDVLKLKVKDVYGKEQIDIRETKTGKAKRFSINETLEEVLNRYCSGKGPDEYLVPSRQGRKKAITSRRAYTVINEAGRQAGIDKIGTHSMRKTFGYHYYKQTGDIVTLQKIFNHSTANTTKAYIGIDQESVDNVMRKFKYKNL